MNSDSSALTFRSAKSSDWNVLLYLILPSDGWLTSPLAVTKVPH
jgi:hypothetical protein